MTRTLTRTLILITALSLPAGAVLASTKLSKETQDRVRTTLTEQGYEVRKINMEDGMIEAYAMKDGKRYELYLDADMNIVKTKTDD